MKLTSWTPTAAGASPHAGEWNTAACVPTLCVHAYACAGDLSVAQRVHAEPRFFPPAQQRPVLLCMALALRLRLWLVGRVVGACAWLLRTISNAVVAADDLVELQRLVIRSGLFPNLLQLARLQLRDEPQSNTALDAYGVIKLSKDLSCKLPHEGYDFLLLDLIRYQIHAERVVVRRQHHQCLDQNLCRDVKVATVCVELQNAIRRSQCSTGARAAGQRGWRHASPDKA